jgi:hypothetical protein
MIRIVVQVSQVFSIRRLPVGERYLHHSLLQRRTPLSVAVFTDSGWADRMQLH